MLLIKNTGGQRAFYTCQTEISWNNHRRTGLNLMSWDDKLWLDLTDEKYDKIVMFLYTEMLRKSTKIGNKLMSQISSTLSFLSY